MLAGFGNAVQKGCCQCANALGCTHWQGCSCRSAAPQGGESLGREEERGGSIEAAAGTKRAFAAETHAAAAAAAAAAAGTWHYSREGIAICAW